MKSKVLLTGVTGFIGAHTTIQLLDQGFQVIGTSRSHSKGKYIKNIIAQHTQNLDKLHIVEAHLDYSVQQWEALLEGVDYIQHIASPFPRVQPKDPNQLIGPAKIGVLNILQAAANQGVKRVVLTSSTGAIAYGRKKRGLFTEADWTDETNLKDTTPYFRSKTIAEKVAWEFIEQHQSDLELTVVNPALVLGPLLDSKDYGTSAGYILKMLDGSLPALAKIGYGMVDVRSITDLLAKAMLHPKAAGERFIGSTDYWTMREVAQVLREHFPQRKIPKASLPNFILRLFAMIDKEAAPVIIEIGAERKLSNEKAKKMLGWQPIANQQAIIDTAKSLIQHKFVS